MNRDAIEAELLEIEGLLQDERLGHAKPGVTLAIYAHMFTSDDSKAAAAINAALSIS